MAQTYEINLINLIEKFRSEDKCRAYLESLRWPGGVACPRCEGEKVSRIQGRDQFDCLECKYQFSVTSGTIMHDTHLPLWKWFLAVYLTVESKKGISANQLKRHLKVAYRTAWYLSHRIRRALQTPHGLLSGIVEVDETYIGGKKRGGGRGYRKNKTIAVGAIERGGDVRIETVKDGKRVTLREFIARTIHDDASAIFTDDNPAYGNLADANTRHETVNHSAKEYVRGDVHTNSIENVWSLFKRSIVGAYHKISAKHLDAYLDEFEFRFNNRDNPFIFRDAMRELLDGEHVEYKELVA